MQMTTYTTIMCSSRKYPDPHHGGNRKFRRGGGVNGPGNSKGEGGFKAKFTSRWSGKSIDFS